MKPWQRSEWRLGFNSVYLIGREDNDCDNNKYEDDDDIDGGDGVIVTMTDGDT